MYSFVQKGGVGCTVQYSAVYSGCHKRLEEVIRAQCSPHPDHNNHVTNYPLCFMGSGVITLISSVIHWKIM